MPRRGSHLILSDPVADAAADNWRELSLLRNWAIDGVVLSNGEPGVMQGSGKTSRRAALQHMRAGPRPVNEALAMGVRAPSPPCGHGRAAPVRS